MKCIMSVLSYTVLLLLCLGGLSAQAATIYVRSQGNDATPCAQAQNAQTPRRTLNAGIACLASGDTLIVDTGTYDECLADYGPTPIPAGTSWQNATTIKAASGATVWLKPTTDCKGAAAIELAYHQYIIIDGLNIDRARIGGWGVGTGSHYLRFQNLEVKNTSGSGLKIDGHYGEYLNLHVHDCGNIPAVTHGFYVSGWYNLIDHARLHHNACNGVQFTDEGGTVTGNIIQNSDIYNNPCYGVVSFPSNHLYNNLIYNNANGAKVLSDTKILNNVFYNNSNIGLWPEGSGQEIKNNIAIGNAYDILNQDTGSVNAAANICTAVGAQGIIGCTMAANPATAFQDSSVNDFHLRAGSPAIGAGVPVSSLGLNVDKDGVPRPATGPVDVGAYQYRLQGPVVPAPQRLRAVVQ